MTNLTFYFDPVCPWAWRASQWVREVQRQTDLVVDWKFFSLGKINNLPNEEILHPLRIEALARRQGGNELVDKLYVALGTALHENGLDAREPGVMQAAVAKALVEGGFEKGFLDEALTDPTTLETVMAEHDEAVEKYKAYGVPWLIVDDTGFGFNGPVITEVPQGKAALELWEHFAWLIQQPYFYEVKRNR